MDERACAYLAGLIDGEGYIGIKKARSKHMVSPSYQARIQVRMVDEPAIKFLADMMGGNYYLESPSAAKGRPLFCYAATAGKAEIVLRLILPYLRVKRTVAETVLEFRALQATSRQHRDGKILTDEYLARCDAFYLRCKEINRPGS